MIKKIKDKRLTLSVIVILVLISIIFLVIKLSKNNKVMKITTVKKSYDFVSLVNYRLTREVTKKYYEMFGL